MDKRTIEILDIIKKFILALESNNIAINRAILFGSFAKGNYNEWSDIDVALVSDAFIGKRFLDKEKIRKFKLKTDYRLSPLPYRPEDFNESDYFVKEILSTGIEVPLD